MMENRDFQKIQRTPIKYMPIMFLILLSLNILGLVLPLTMKKIYSTIIVEESVQSLRLILGLALIALLIESIMQKVRNTSSRWIASKYEYSMISYLTNKLLQAHDQYSQSNTYVDYLKRFRSVVKLSRFYSKTYYQLYMDVPFMMIFLYLMYLYGGMIVLVPLTVILIYLVTGLVFWRGYFRNQKNTVYMEKKLTEHMVQSLEKIHLVKAGGIEESQIRKYREILNKHTVLEYEGNKLQIVPRVLSANISQFSLFMTLLAGGYLMMNGNITFPQITACALLSGRAIRPVKSVMRYYLQTREIKMIEKELEEISRYNNQYSEEVPYFPSEIEGNIEAISVKYQNIYTGNNESLSIDIGAREFFAFHPKKFPSYRQIFQMISGREPIEDGKILIDNLDITEWNMHSLTGKIEYIKDNTIIYKGSVLENLTMFDLNKVESAYDAAALVGLDKLISQLPEGYNTELDDYSKNYISAGFIQRLNLARALVVRPRILLLDPVDENMDDDTYEIFLWLLEKLKGELTLIVATRDKHILGFCEDYEDKIAKVRKELVYER